MADMFMQKVVNKIYMHWYLYLYIYSLSNNSNTSNNDHSYQECILFISREKLFNFRNIPTIVFQNNNTYIHVYKCTSCIVICLSVEQ